MKIIPVDDVIARVSAQLRATRSRIGRPVNQADMLIAATALVTGRTLVTRNVRDFENCNVQILNPFEK